MQVRFGLNVLSYILQSHIANSEVFYLMQVHDWNVQERLQQDAGHRGLVQSIEC